MEIIEIKYCTFWHRFLLSTGILILVPIVIIVEYLATYNGSFSFIIINSILIPFLLWILFIDFNRAKKYLSQIEVDESNIQLLIFDLERPLEKIIIPLSDFRLDMTENLFDKWRRFKLEFKRKNYNKTNSFELILKQHEVGDWTMEKQKEVYKIIKHKQGKFGGTSSFGRTIFGEKH